VTIGHAHVIEDVIEDVVEDVVDGPGYVAVNTM